MAYKLKVKDKIYDLKDGFTIKEELNETLDSATGIEFETFHEEFNGVPFDHAVIFDDENKITEKHFLIDTYDDEVYSFEANMEDNNHHYVVKLFSETKGLERVTLPNLTVTQPTTGTKKTVLFTMKKIEYCYFPIYKKYDSSLENQKHYKYAEKYEYTTATEQKFDGFTCPEFQWNEPTLREVLTDLFSVDDCIPVVRQGQISYYSLKEKGNPIDTSKLSYSKRTMSSGDFVGELTLNMKNAIGHNKTVCCEYISLQAPEGNGTLTTENGVIKTHNPIYSIRKIVVYLCDHSRVVFTNVAGRWHKVDVSSRVKEYEDWNILSGVKVSSSMYNDLPSWTDANGLTEKEHKINYLYYERGKNEIHNIGKIYDSSWTALSNFLLRVVGKTIQNVYQTGTIETLGSKDNSLIDPRELFCYVEYETVVEHPMHVGKYLPSPHPENRVFDAQKDSYVDVQHQSIFEYAKVERLGNKIREIYGEYFNETDIPQLGDYIGDEILFSREVTYFDNILLFKGYLTPHYVLKDYYTGVMAKKRSWEIAKGSEALTRHDIYKYYIESSFTPKYDTFLNTAVDPFGIVTRAYDVTTDHNAVERFLSAMTNHDANKNLVHAFIRTQANGTYYPTNEPGFVKGLILDLSTEVQGSSLCFTFGFNDNFKAAEYITKDGDEYVQSFYRYCGENDGYFETATIYLLGKTYGIGKSDPGDIDAVLDLPEIVEEDPNAGYYSADDNQYYININYERPLFEYYCATFENDGLRIVTYNSKDNREITKWSIQFEYCADTADIIIKQRLIDLCDMVDENSNGQLYIAFAEAGFKYSLRDEKANKNVGRYLLTPDVQLYADSVRTKVTPISGNNYSAKFEWFNNTITEALTYGAWAICDANDNILLAVNRNSNVPIYFNMLRVRDTKVYMNSWSQEVAGDISDIEHIEPVE